MKNRLFVISTFLVAVIALSACSQATPATLAPTVPVATAVVDLTEAMLPGISFPLEVQPYIP
jgi:hypothetical protein